MDKANSKHFLYKKKHDTEKSNTRKLCRFAVSILINDLGGIDMAATNLSVYLPSPYEDELLYSIVARYCSQAHQRVYKLTCVLFEKCFLIFRADLPGSLAAVAKSTRHCWGISEETILNTMTLFPYYAPFLSSEARLLRKKALISGPCRANIGVKAYRVTPPTHLRICVQCAEKDRQALGEPYWHRAHQLPGVLVCPKHRTPLVSTSVHIQPRRTECIDASSARILDAESLKDVKVELVLKIAQRCRDILSGEILIWKSDYSPRAYREAALERGITRLPGIFSPTIFLEGFINHYGISLLAKLGVFRTGCKMWVSNIFQNNRNQVFHPVEHILVQLFLESLPKISEAYPFGEGPWMCPNPYGAHSEEFPINKITIRSRHDNTYYGRARCSCGFSFTIKGVGDATPQLPIIDKIWSFGPTRYHFAQKLLQSGSTLSETAKILKVQLSHLKKILDTGKVESQSVENKCLNARREWLELLQEDSHRRVTVARRKRYGLYQYLRKHDQKWLLGQKEPHKRPIDWQKRDLEWSTLIAKTVKRVGACTPKTVIIKVTVNRSPSCRPVQ